MADLATEARHVRHADVLKALICADINCLSRYAGASVQDGEHVWV